MNAAAARWALVITFIVSEAAAALVQFALRPL